MPGAAGYRCRSGPLANADMRFERIGIGVQMHVFVLQAAPQPLDEDVVCATGDFPRSGPRSPLPPNHLLCENRDTLGRIAEVGLTQQLTQPGRRVIINPAEDIGEPGFRVDVMQLGGLDQREHRGATLATPIRREPIMPGVCGARWRSHTRSTH
jgi:hypothetical protein